MKVIEAIEKTFGISAYMAACLTLWLSLIVLWYNFYFKKGNGIYSYKHSIYKKRLLNWNKIALTGAFLLIITGICIILPYWYKEIRLPSPTPKGKISIWIARFKSDNSNEWNNGLITQLNNFKLDNKLKNIDIYNMEIRDIEREIRGKTLEEQFSNAKTIGKKLNASIVVFGTEVGDVGHVYIKIINEDTYKLFTGSEKRMGMTLAELSKIELTSDISQIGNTAKVINGIILYNNKNYKQAKEIFKNILSEIQKDDTLLRKDAILYYTGNCESYLGKHDEAIKVFNRSIEINPENSAALSNKGVALYNLGKHNEAIKSFDRAIIINPECADFWSNKGATLHDLGKHDEALEACKKSIEINPEYAIALYNKGVILYHLGKHDESIKAFNIAIDIDPDYSSAYYNKGVILGKMGKYKEALEAYDKAIITNPNNVNIWHNKGISLVKTRKYREAVEAFNIATKINPNNDDIWIGKGSAFGNMGKYKEALEAYDRATKINPNNADAWVGKGVALRCMGKSKEAFEAFNKATKINPNNPDAWIGNGVALGNMGKFKEALEAFNKAIKINPEDEDAWIGKRITLEKMEKYNEAKEAFDKQ